MFQPCFPFFLSFYKRFGAADKHKVVDKNRVPNLLLFSFLLYLINSCSRNILFIKVKARIK